MNLSRCYIERNSERRLESSHVDGHERSLGNYLSCWLEEVAELDPRPRIWEQGNSRWRFSHWEGGRWEKSDRAPSPIYTRVDSAPSEPLPELYFRHRHWVDVELCALAALHGVDINVLRARFIDSLWNGPLRMRSAVFVAARAGARWWLGHLQGKRERGVRITLDEKRSLVKFWHNIYPALGADALVAQLEALVDRKFVASELRDLKVIGFCLNCAEPLTGRSDRKYCNDTCSTNHRRRTPSQRGALTSGSRA
jgi:hypothetical protein